MNLTRDTYEYLTNFADDKTILDMLSVNKSFNEPILFERIFKRKYPLLIQFKKEDETWKNFYLKMVYYISKIKEEYDIPYISSNTYDPEKIYNKRNRKGKYNIYNWLFYNAVRSGQIDIVKKLLSEKKEILSEKYNFEIPDYPYIKTIFDLALSAASLRGYIEIVELIFDFSNNFARNKALIDASQNGYLNIVKFLVDKGANRLDKALILATRAGKVNVIDFLIGRGAKNFNAAMSAAVTGNRIDMVKLMLSKGADDLNRSLLNAAKRGNLEILKFLIKQGANDLEGALKLSENVDIMNYLIEKIESLRK